MKATQWITRSILTSVFLIISVLHTGCITDTDPNTGESRIFASLNDDHITKETRTVENPPNSNRIDHTPTSRISNEGNARGLPSVKIGNILFKTQIASTEYELFRGLSHKKYLDPMSGMLFLFQDMKTTAFWMKNMLIPLDLVWIGENCIVVDLHHDVPNPSPDVPLSELPVYTSSVPAAYTFEINSGTAKRFNINIGDTVTFLNIDNPIAQC